jgi:hypothetical protein
LQREYVIVSSLRGLQKIWEETGKSLQIQKILISIKCSLCSLPVANPGLENSNGSRANASRFSLCWQIYRLIRRLDPHARLAALDPELGKTVTDETDAGVDVGLDRFAVRGHFVEMLRLVALQIVDKAKWGVEEGV